MADIPDKQIKRLRALIAEAETALAATKELLISMVGDDSVLTEKVKDKALGKVIEGVFDGQNMVGRQPLQVAPQLLRDGIRLYSILIGPEVVTPSAAAAKDSM